MYASQTANRKSSTEFDIWFNYKWGYSYIWYITKLAEMIRLIFIHEQKFPLACQHKCMVGYTAGLTIYMRVIFCAWRSLH